MFGKTRKNKNKNKTQNKKIKTKTKTKKNIKFEKKKYINGPCTMYYYPNLPNDRKLLIFGENHFTPNPCDKNKKGAINIVDYLTKIANNTEECLDIYIEEFYKTKQFTRFNFLEEYYSLRYGIENFINLNKLRKTFRRCDDRNKLFCKYKNARIHFSDPRTIYKTNVIEASSSIDKFIENVINGSILVTPEIYLMQTNISTDCYQYSTNYPKFKEVIKFLMGWKREDKYRMYYIDYISYINGGYSFGAIINSWCDEYFKIIDKEKKKIKNFSIEKIYKTLYKIYINYYENNMSTFNITLSIPMDMYFIFRYLMNFKNSNMNRGPIGCKDTNYSKKTIMYCGYAHAETYNHFINDFFKVEPEIIIEQRIDGVENSCLELPDGFEF